MPITVHAFPENARLARRVAALAGAPCRPVHVHAFPDGESLLSVGITTDEAVLVRSLDHPNAKLLEILLAADALRRAGARRLTLVAPYLPYMRQDAMFQNGQPISQRVVCSLLRRAFDRVLTVAAHLHRVASLRVAIGPGSRSLSPAVALAAWLRRGRQHPVMIVGPDVESEPLVRAVGRASAAAWVTGQKQRRGDRRVEVRFGELPAASEAVLIDDIASSGATLIAAARALRSRGVTCTTAVAVHALFSPETLERLRAAGITRMVTTDTIPHPTNAIACAPLIAAALRTRTAQVPARRA